VWRLALITAPTKEPLGAYGTGTPPPWDLRGDVYKHLRLEQTTEMGPEDTWLQAAVATARSQCETFTGRQLIDATWELVLDSWWEEGLYRNGFLLIPRPPLRSITSVKYLDGNGVEQTLAASAYLAETQGGGVPATAPIPEACQRGRLYLKYGETWPTIQCQAEAVRIRFVAGYGTDPASVPLALRQGMLQLIAEMYERREEAIVGGVLTPGLITAHRLWWPFRAW
jgi:uncharacterized phiE125 gp8 family phage protein